MLDLDTNSRDVARKLRQLGQKQMPFVTSQTINALAFSTMNRERREIVDVIDRPTPFTQRGVMYTRSSKRNLVATVYVPESRESYMIYQVRGGKRTPRNVAVPIPSSSARLNKYGNMRRNYISRMLDSPKHFSGVPRGRPRSSAGIYERKRHKIVPIVLWKREAQYRPKFDFYGVGRDHVKRNAQREFERAIDRALVTSMQTR